MLFRHTIKLPKNSRKCSVEGHLHNLDVFILYTRLNDVSNIWIRCYNSGCGNNRTIEKGCHTIFCVISDCIYRCRKTIDVLTYSKLNSKICFQSLKCLYICWLVSYLVSSSFCVIKDIRLAVMNQLLAGTSVQVNINIEFLLTDSRFVIMTVKKSWQNMGSSIQQKVKDVIGAFDILIYMFNLYVFKNI